MDNIVFYNTFEPAFISVFISGLMIGASAVYIFFKRRRYITTDNITKNVLILRDYREETFEIAYPGEDCSLVMCVRNDLKMRKGKVAAQCSHAAVQSYINGMKYAPRMVRLWLAYGAKKVALKVDSERELKQLFITARRHTLLTYLVRDAGHSHVPFGTRTILAIGPAPKLILHTVIGHLKLY